MIDTTAYMVKWKLGDAQLRRLFKTREEAEKFYNTIARAADLYVEKFDAAYEFQMLAYHLHEWRHDMGGFLYFINQLSAFALDKPTPVSKAQMFSVLDSVHYVTNSILEQQRQDNIEDLFMEEVVKKVNAAHEDTYKKLISSLEGCSNKSNS